MRLLQDTVTGWGVDTLWIYHLRSGLDGQARQVESTTISVVELARCRNDEPATAFDRRAKSPWR